MKRRLTANRVALGVLCAVVLCYSAWALEPWSGRRYIERVDRILRDPANGRAIEQEVGKVFSMAADWAEQNTDFGSIDLEEFGVLSQLGDIGLLATRSGMPRYLVVRTDGGFMRSKIRTLWFFPADPVPGTDQWNKSEGLVLYRLSETIFVSGWFPASALKNNEQRRSQVSPSDARTGNGRAKSGRS